MIPSVSSAGRHYDQKVVGYLDEERQRLATIIAEHDANAPARDWFVRRLADVSETLDRYIAGGGCHYKTPTPPLGAASAAQFLAEMDAERQGRIDAAYERGYRTCA